jgi:HupF/HypC family
MCVCLPGEVVSMRGPMARVETAGVKRCCNALMYPELRLGDRVSSTPASWFASSPRTRRARPEFGASSSWSLARFSAGPRLAGA